MKPLTSKNELHQIFQVSIRSYFDYCSPVFVSLNKKLTNRLDRIVRRAHYIIFEDNEWSCNCTSLTERRITMAKNLFLNIEKQSNHVLHAKFPTRLPRSCRFRNFPCQTDRRLKSFFPSMTLLINKQMQS